MLDDIVNEYNKTVHITIKIKPIDITDDSYAEYNEGFNKKDTKFKVGDHVKIQKQKHGQKKFLLLVKLKTQIHGHM